MNSDSFLPKKHSLKLPSLFQITQIFTVLNKKERNIFLTLLILFFASLFFLTINFYYKNTELKQIPGGSFTEGVIGYPRFINPIYAELSDTDRDLTQLVFSGLMKYDTSGQITPDIIDDYIISNDSKSFEIHIKENIAWHDKEKLTIDDVIFTIETIQNPEYKSPLIAAWAGVEVERISEFSMNLKLRNPSAVFLENLTLKILPKHIWQNIKPEQFPLDPHNLKPIGSGPYKIKETNIDRNGIVKSLILETNKNYFKKEPYIQEITFKFYNNEEEIARSARRREIQGFSVLNPQNFDILERQDFNSYAFSLPRYFAVFFNIENSETLSNLQIRQALNYGTNKEEIINSIFEKFGKQGTVANSPVLPNLYGLKEPSEIYNFDIEKAQALLEKAEFIKDETGQRFKAIKTDAITAFKSDLKIGSQGAEVKELQRCLMTEIPEVSELKITGSFDRSTEEAVKKFQEKFTKDILEPWGFTEGTGQVSKTTITKLNEICDLSPYKILPLEISLITANQPILIEVANILKTQWEKIGVSLLIETFNTQNNERDNIIKNRDYEAILFGEALSLIPDPMPFWHSSQKKDPGLNLSLYENKEADKLLEEIRQSLNQETRSEKLEQLQDIIIQEAPALFLYNHDYVYVTSRKINGIQEQIVTDPSKRFSDIENWYINTKRVWKIKEKE